MTRRAESSKVRRWNGVVANANELEEYRVWVVWGLAAPPEIAAEPDDRYPPGAPAPDLAVRMAEQADPEFAAADDLHRWIMLVEGDEDDVDAWVADHPEASAYASYLLEAARAGDDPPFKPTGDA
jgi:hypothetical protein